MAQTITKSIKVKPPWKKYLALSFHIANDIKAYVAIINITNNIIISFFILIK